DNEIPQAATAHDTAWDFFSQQPRSEEHTSELQSRPHLVCRLLLEKKRPKVKRPKTSGKPKCPSRGRISSAARKGNGHAEVVDRVFVYFFLIMRNPPDSTFFPSTSLSR